MQSSHKFFKGGKVHGRRTIERTNENESIIRNANYTK